MHLIIEAETPLMVENSSATTAIQLFISHPSNPGYRKILNLMPGRINDKTLN